MRSPVLVMSVICTSLVVGGTGCAVRETSNSPSRAALRAARAPRPARSSTEGSRGSTAVGSFVRERQAQLQFCYQEARAKQAGLSGTITVEVTLGDGGAVDAAGVVRRSWRGDGADVERCVLATVRRWRFPTPGSEDERDHSFAVIFSDAAATPAAPRDE